MSNNPCSLNEVSNRNLLSIGGFKLVINKCPKVDFLCNKANLPGLSLGVAVQANYLRDLPVPGEKLTYQDLRVDFLVDEKLENYIQLYEWMTSLGFPENFDQFSRLQKNSRYFPDGNNSFQERSDATLIILNSNYQEAGTIKFRDLFPVELTGIPFDATIEQQQYYTATAIFKYTMYDLIDNDGQKV